MIYEVSEISEDAADRDIANQLLSSPELIYTVNTIKETVCSIARVLDA